MNIHWAEPKQPNDIYDMDAVERYLQFNFGWFAHPILKDGKYPTIMRQKIDFKSKNVSDKIAIIFSSLWVMYLRVKINMLKVPFPQFVPSAK